MIERKIEKGYVLVYCPNHKYSKGKNGWIQEHRLVMENSIGRSLNESEVVHHIDLNKQNNNISNLMKFVNQKEHSRFHQKMKQFGMTNSMIKKIDNKDESS